MDPRPIGGLCLAFATACGADVLSHAPTPEPDFAVELVMAEDGVSDETPRRFIHRPHVDCNPIEEVGYRRGKQFPITVVTIDGDLVERSTADAYWAMRNAAAEDGIDLVIYSGFRTQREQQYFYRCFRDCSCNGCSPAAKPGHSNHQSGRALDLAMIPGAHDWLVANAKRFDFHATVSREPWHWEHRPRKRSPRWPALCTAAPPAP